MHVRILIVIITWHLQHNLFVCRCKIVHCQLKELSHSHLNKLALQDIEPLLVQLISTLCVVPDQQLQHEWHDIDAFPLLVGTRKCLHYRQ